MTIEVVKFRDLEKAVSESRRLLDLLAPEIGKVYVISVTRDGCGACEKQKPKFNELASKLLKTHGDNISFKRVHVAYSKGSEEESLRSKDAMGHYFYPTNSILVKTSDRGSIEFYRNVNPDMKELEKNIDVALEVASFMKGDSTQE
ncbi:MAG: hypothetical protein JSV35_06830 [Candidatus Bathyarchaeota archaeon]|nr:MAG: hypothetical protein JSV35_06830 [Candidatus Bathyarchaeota archaeon]